MEEKPINNLQANVTRQPGAVLERSGQSPPSFLQLLAVAGLSLALLLTAGAVWAAPATLMPSAQAGGSSQVGPLDCSWQVVSSPNQGISDNSLNGVAAISSIDVWAVGYSRSNNQPHQALVEHWNGSTWSVVSSLNPGTTRNILTGVAAVSSNDVWAVGYYSVSFADFTLVEHWNGSTWSVVSSPNQGTDPNLLTGVAAISSNDVWAVGAIGTNVTSQTLVEHWDGSTWSIVTSPNPGTEYNALTGVTAVSASDVWAVGSSRGSNGQYQTLVEHWDGSTWSEVTSPNQGVFTNALNGVAAISSNDVWAVGSYNNGNTIQTLVEHWDGSIWSIVTSPNQGADPNTLTGVAAISSSDVWAVGAIGSFNNPHQTLMEHWDGSTWSIVPSPNPSTDNLLTGVAAISASDVWAVGAIGASTYQTLVEHYTGCGGGTPVPTSTSAPPTATPTPIVCTPGQFSDVPPDSTFYPYVTCLVNREVISGYDDCTFRPGNNMTRGQVSKVVSNAAAFNDDVTGRQTYTDVPSSSPFWAWVERLSLHGVMGGYNCGGPNEPCDGQNRPYFRPNTNITRGQLSKIGSNAAGFNDTPTGQTFEDVPSTNTFWLFIERLSAHGAIGGYNCGEVGEPCGVGNRPYFRPGNNVTRGQASKIIANAFFPNCSSK